MRFSPHSPEPGRTRTYPEALSFFSFRTDRIYKIGEALPFARRSDESIFPGEKTILGFVEIRTNKYAKFPEATIDSVVRDTNPR